MSVKIIYVPNDDKPQLAAIVNKTDDKTAVITVAVSINEGESELVLLRRICATIFNNTKTMAQEERCLNTALGKAMKESGNYKDDADIVQNIRGMRLAVQEGEDPEEVLHNEGFEPDFVMDLL